MCVSPAQKLLESNIYEPTCQIYRVYDYPNSEKFGLCVLQKIVEIPTSWQTRIYLIVLLSVQVHKYN